MRIKKFRSRRPLYNKKTPGKRRRLPWKSLILASFLFFIGFSFVYGKWFLPQVKVNGQLPESLAFSESTIIYDRGALDPSEDPNDHVLYVIHGEENRDFVPIEKMSPWIGKATLAIEDDQFYDHWGFDLPGLTKAVCHEVSSKIGLGNLGGLCPQRGGSTVTQQLVVNTFLQREHTYTRKYKELLLAIKMESNYEKESILELYLNKIPYGNNAYGVEAAAKTYFNKSARELTIAESAILASLPNAPSRYNPYGTNKDLLLGYYEIDPETGVRVYRKGRKDLVLQRMLDLKMITFEQFKQAVIESRNLEFKSAKVDIKAPHFVFHVMQQLEDKYGKEFLKEGGLRIYTTIDKELQEAAKASIAVKSEHYESTYGAKNVAMAAINPDTGEIMAYVGGKDYFNAEIDGQVDVLTSRRQPGSSFKPFVYAAAFEKGYGPATVLFDVETDFGGNYTPQNFDQTFMGPVSARHALNRSLNIPAIKMAYLASPQKVLELAQKIGIKFEGNAAEHSVAIGVGVAEVEPLSHINAYQAFTGDGSYYLPTAILEIQDSDGKALEKADFSKQKKEGLDSEIAALVRNILTDESARPTTDDFDWNKLLQLEGFNNGAKTGTSNRVIPNPAYNAEAPESEANTAKISAPGDSWTVGFTPHLVAGVWVGNNRGEPMKPGATGMTVAAPIWHKFMTDAHKILVEDKDADPEKLYNEPKMLEVRKVNKYSGKLATDKTPEGLVVEEVFASFAVPTELDDSVEVIKIDRRTGEPANRLTPYYAVTEQSVLKLSSVRPDLPNWQNPINEWLKDHPLFRMSFGEEMDDNSEDELFDDNRRERTYYRPRFPSRYRDDPPRTNNRTLRSAAPEVMIVSPKNEGMIVSGRVEVFVDARSQVGVNEVKFYFDGTPIDQARRFPWTGQFSLPEDTETGKPHTIKVEVVDRYGQTAVDEITVFIIGNDTNPPQIIFLGPTGNQRIPLQGQVNILADVKDAESSVKVVEFMLDDESLKIDEEAPYEAIFKAEGELGRHFIKAKAWDFYGNVSEKSIPVIFERAQLLSSTTPEISKISDHRNSVSIDVSIPKAEAVAWVELVAEQEEEVIFSQKIDNPSSFLQFHILKNHGGSTNLKAYTKFKDSDRILESAPKTVSL